MSAVQPTATTTSAASALLRAPSFEKIIRTPSGVFSNDSIDAEALVHPDAGRAEGLRDGRGDVFVLASAGCAGRLEELARACRRR